MIFDLGGN